MYNTDNKEYINDEEFIYSSINEDMREELNNEEFMNNYNNNF
jgi:hypothetical protein